MDDHGLRLSVVATSRNDDHGANLLRRMQTFVNAFIGQCRRHNLRAELILVEWNPPADRPRLAQALRWPTDPSPCEVRIIEVPEALHRRFSHSEALPLYQMIAKNVGIRRARGRFILATNIDILFDDELMRFLKDGDLQAGKIYRIDRTDVETDVPVDASVEEQLAYCSGHLLRFNTAYGTFPARVEADVIAEQGGISLLRGVWPAERDETGEVMPLGPGGHLRGRDRACRSSALPAGGAGSRPKYPQSARDDRGASGPGGCRPGPYCGPQCDLADTPPGPRRASCLSDPGRGRRLLPCPHPGGQPPARSGPLPPDLVGGRTLWPSGDPGGRFPDPPARPPTRDPHADIMAADSGIGLDQGWQPLQKWAGMKYRRADAGARLAVEPGSGSARTLDLWVAASGELRDRRDAEVQVRDEQGRVLATAPLTAWPRRLGVPICPAPGQRGLVTLDVRVGGSLLAGPAGARVLCLFSCAWSDRAVGQRRAAAVRARLFGLRLWSGHVLRTLGLRSQPRPEVARPHPEPARWTGRTWGRSPCRSCTPTPAATSP